MTFENQNTYGINAETEDMWRIMINDESLASMPKDDVNRLFNEIMYWQTLAIGLEERYVEGLSKIGEIVDHNIMGFYGVKP